MSHWSARRVVVRDFYISLKPLGSDGRKYGMDISAPAFGQAEGEAVYVVITGRPAGLVNFIREHIGLSRRFEFLITNRQCIERIGSPSTQVLSTSRICGLNTFRVGLIRPLRESAFVMFLAFLSFLAGLHLIPSPQSFSPPNGGVEQQKIDPLVGQEVYDSASSSNAIAEVVTEDKGGEGAQMGRSSPTTGSDIFFIISSVVLSVYAAYLFFVAKRNWISASEGGESVVDFMISPSLLESKSTDIPLQELNRIPLIFNALKSD